MNNVAQSENRDGAELIGLREEASKFRDYVLCDEIVHRAELGCSDHKPSHVLPQHYLLFDDWARIHWTYLDAREGRDAHYYAILEPIDNGLCSISRRDPNIPAVHRDGSVFVDVPQLIQSPKVVREIGVGSVLRLKRVKYRCHCGWKESQLRGVCLSRFTDGEYDLSGVFIVLGNGRRIKVNQVPGEVIKGGPEAAYKVPGDQRDALRNADRLNDESVHLPLRIVVFGDRVRTSINEFNDPLLKSLKVEFCPSGFSVDVLQ